MIGVAMQHGQITKGLPHTYYFVLASGTVDTSKTLWLGPDYQISKTAPLLVQDGSSNRWICALTPDEVGMWTLVVRDASNGVLHTAQFQGVKATTEEMAYGLVRDGNAPVEVFPSEIFNDSTFATGSTAQTNSGSILQRCFVSQGKYVCPHDGYIWGIRWRVNDGFLGVTSLQFFTMDSTTTLVRGISEDLKGVAPVQRDSTTVTAYSSTTGWYLVYFNKPVPCRAGDWFGFYVDDTAGSGATGHLRRGTTKTNTATVQKFRRKDSALSLTGTNTFTDFGTPITDAPGVKLVTRPPQVVMAGHSFWAGSPGSGPIFDDSVRTFARAIDPATQLSVRLGAPVINCAKGGTSLADWVGSSGLFETRVTPLKPSVMLFDTVYNDANTGYGRDGVTDYTSADYMMLLDRLLAHCDQQGVELILLEAPGSYYATQNLTAVGGLDFAAQIEKLNAIVAQWCQHHGVGYVPLMYRIGWHTGGAEHLSLRRQQKHFGTDFASWGLADYDSVSSDNRVHLSQAGINAATTAMAQWFRHRNIEPRFHRPQTTLANVLPTDSGFEQVRSIKSKTDNLPASPAAVGSVMQLDLAQSVPNTNTAQTIGDALNAARADGFGKWVQSGTTLTLYAADGTTAVRSFTLDNATSPTQRA